MSAYSSLGTHLRMNFDGIRNQAYQKAISECVTSNSIVLDLGAGLGMLGFIAARAGARKVYLVEPEPVIEISRKVALANGINNIECIQTTAEDLKLTHKVDVILSVFTGNFLLTEDLLPSLFYARDNFLASGGKLIPDRARMIVAPVSAKDYYQENVEMWSSGHTETPHDPGHGVDYGVGRSFLVNSMFYDSSDKFNAHFLAEPGCLKTIDFMKAKKADCDDKVNATITSDGECHGWLGWFDMRLGERWLSTAPDADSTHWRQVFMPVDRPFKVKAGQSLGFNLKRPEHGEWTWTTEHNGTLQRQSTFLSEPITPDLVRKRSDSYQPQLNARGQATAFVLSNFKGSSTSSELTDSVCQRFPNTFSSREEALRFVKALVKKFG